MNTERRRCLKTDDLARQGTQSSACSNAFGTFVDYQPNIEFCAVEASEIAAWKVLNASK